MGNRLKIIVVVGVLVFAALFVWLFNRTESTAKPQKRSYISAKWEQEYELTSKDPRGLYLFNLLLQAKLDTNNSIEQINHPNSIDSISENASFVFVGEQLILTQQEIVALLEHVKKGSKLFLSQHQIDNKILLRLFKSFSLSYSYGATVNIKTKNNTYTFYNNFKGDTIARKWRGIEDANATPLSIQSLSKIGEIQNSIAIQYGKGFVYLNFTPELFYNYQMKTNPGYVYAKHWTNRMPKTANIYWLELGRFNKLPEKQEETDGEADDSYLQYILQEKSLLTAMLVALGGLILYVVFRSKRTQPITPILKEKRNMTVAFADIITSIYYSQRNPASILNVQKQNFYSAVAKHFYVDLSKNKERNITNLAQKTNQPEKRISALIKLFEQTPETVSEEHILEVGKQQLSFYRDAGIISEKAEEIIQNREHFLYRNGFVSTLLVLFGVITVFIGFNLLVKAVGVGVLLWPIGGAIIAFGIWRMNRPILRIKGKTISYFPLFGKKKECDASSVFKTETTESQTRFFVENGKQIIINHWELSKADGSILKRFVSAQKQ